MKQIDLQQLEERTEALLTLLKNLKQENSTLKAQNQHLERDNRQLLNKVDLTAERLKHWLDRLNQLRD